MTGGDKTRFRMMNIRFLLTSLALVCTSIVAQDTEGFSELFNGRDLTGWEGDSQLWSVKDGLVTGVCSGPESPSANTFLIWRGGQVKNFELRATVRVIGDNNSGIQYRSRPLPEAGPWGITGYQCDIHPATEHTGMTYEEKGRGIFGLNGKDIVLDDAGNRWQVAEREPVKVDVSQWNEYTIIAEGNRLTHKINGQITSQLTDCDEAHRALEGLLAIQLHHGNANTVQIKDLRLKALGEAPVTAFDPSLLPAGAQKVTRPGTKNPQGLGPASSKKK